MGGALLSASESSGGLRKWGRLHGASEQGLKVVSIFR